jgi:hypothetical protein
MFGGWSQLNENLQGDFSILQQISALKRENRFLKVGLIFCLVLSALPYLTGFQPETIRASKVVTERLEFVRDGKTVMSFSLNPKSDGLVIWSRDKLPVIGITRDKDVGVIGIYNKDGTIVAGMKAGPLGGGRLFVCNKAGGTAAIMGEVSGLGIILLYDDKGQTTWSVP